MIRILLALVFLSFVFASPATKAQERSRVPQAAVAGCQIDFAMRMEFGTYRLAGLTEDEAMTSMGFSLRIADYYVQEAIRDGAPLTDTTIEEQTAIALQMLQNIYTMEPFSQAILNAWASNNARECVKGIDIEIQERNEDEKRKRKVGERTA